MLLRPSIVAIVIGTSLSIAATGTVSLALVASLTLAWSFVVFIQLVAAFATVSIAPGRVLPLGRAVDAFFALHVPWSAWLLLWAAWSWAAPPADRYSAWVLWTALVPAAWTALLIYRFCRDVLTDSPRGAFVRVCVHQAIVWSAFLLIGGAAVALWPRLLRLA